MANLSIPLPSRKMKKSPKEYNGNTEEVDVINNLLCSKAQCRFDSLLFIWRLKSQLKMMAEYQAGYHGIEDVIYNGCTTSLFLLEEFEKMINDSSGVNHG